MIIVVRYDMMIGVTSAEAFILLNSVEMELGLETESRNKLVSDLVIIISMSHINHNNEKNNNR